MARRHAAKIVGVLRPQLRLGHWPPAKDYNVSDKEFSYDEPLSMIGTPSPSTNGGNGDNGGNARNGSGGHKDAASAAQAAETVQQSAQQAMLQTGPLPERAGCATACPLAQIPAEVWKTLLRRPFRKRRPILFWGGVLLVLGLIGGLIVKASDDGGPFTGGGRIALVSVNGPILSADPTLEWLRKVAQNPSVKGILVRVDSPGGGAAASQEIYDALKAVGQKMPVAVSMGSMAASGGLMVSMAGQRVFANPSTVTGSIGVRMDVPQLQGLMDKVGVG